MKRNVIAAMFALAIAAPAWSQPAARTATIVDASAALESAARIAAPSVVSIFTTSFAPGQGRLTRAADLVATERGAGSGVIVDPSGFIITNAHVVNGAHQLSVQLPAPAGGQSILGRRSRTVKGTVIGVDLETDLALIRVEEQGLPAMQFADSDTLRVGQLVLALGNPMGLEGSVSLGVVSAVARQLAADSPMIYVQTDASINPGSSGGALIDTKGRLAGINTLIVSQAGGNEGLGFAAPSNIVKAVYEQLKAHGRVRRGDIGVRAQTITPALASALTLARQEGVILADVLPGSPAQRAGLQAGDVVLALDGKPMENARQLHVGLYRRFVGAVVMLDVLRAEARLSLPVAMTEQPDSWSSVPVMDPRDHLVPRLGILAVTLDRALAEAVPVVRVRAGVLVASTVAAAIDSRDDGLQEGDVIYAVNRIQVSSLADLRSVLEGMRAGDAVVLHLERNGELRYLAFVIE
jgi:serine protease Do